MALTNTPGPVSTAPDSTAPDSTVPDSTVPVSMVPGEDRLPDVLPTSRLNASGKPLPPLRDELRRIRGVRNTGTLILAWMQIIGTAAVAAWLSHPAVWIAAFVVQGRNIGLLAILGHEAAHRLLWRRRWCNDHLGRWLVAYPSFTPLDVYRRGHMAHHRDEMGPDEPDLNLYVGYPITRASLRRKLVRDAVGISGWKNLKPLFTALGSASARPVALSILSTQVVMLGAATLAGRPELYFFFWFAPYMTVWRVINRLRGIAEHGGMERSDDRRRTTHVVRQTPLARFWMVPYHTGWHLAHHVDIGVPWRNLPRLHDELVRAGWVTPAIEYPSYRALWRALSARP